MIFLQVSMALILFLWVPGFFIYFLFRKIIQEEKENETLIDMVIKVTDDETRRKISSSIMTAILDRDEKKLVLIKTRVSEIIKEGEMQNG